MWESGKKILAPFVQTAQGPKNFFHAVQPGRMWGLLALAGWFLGGAAASAAPVQPLPDPQTPAKTFMSKNVFYLPVKIEDAIRPNLREVRLYVKDHPGKPWMLQEKVPPTQTYFTFRAPREGEFWFTVVTVDKMGRPSPNDLRNEGPALVVVHDSQPPQVDVQLLPTTSEGITVQCQVRDANPDLTKTGFYFQTGDQVWRPLTPLPGHTDRYCIPPQAVFTGLVRVEAVDLAGNAVRRDFNLGATPLASQGNPAGTVPAGPVVEGTVQQTSFTHPEELSRSARTKIVETVVVQTEKGPSPGGSPSSFPIESAPNQVPGSVMQGPELAPVASSRSPVAVGSQEIARTEIGTKPVQAGNQPDQAHPAGIVSSAPGRKTSSPAQQLVNKNRVFLEYQIDNKGASGVGKVEIWVTRDQGQSWKKLCEDRDRKSPAEIDLPGEGLYGVSLVVSNGRGFGGQPPAAGDAPDWWIEVDSTKPVAEITSVRSDTGSDAGTLVISWQARDKNLASNPIDLYYAGSPDGPWQSIARGLKNDGPYRWAVPANLGSEAYVRLVVRDMAGNTTHVETTQAVALDDHSRPRGRVLGISVEAPQARLEN